MNNKICRYCFFQLCDKIICKMLNGIILLRISEKMNNSLRVNLTVGQADEQQETDKKSGDQNLLDGF